MGWAIAMLSVAVAAGCGRLRFDPIGSANADGSGSSTCRREFGTRVDYPTSQNHRGLALGDVSGDGVVDLVITPDAANAIDVLLGNGDGTFQAKHSYPTDPAQYGDPTNLAIGDVNGDGARDVVAVNTLASTVSVLLNPGDGTFPTHVEYPTGRWPSGDRDRRSRRQGWRRSRRQQFQRRHVQRAARQRRRHVPATRPRHRPMASRSATSTATAFPTSPPRARRAT
jgi:hypothetical protein